MTNESKCDASFYFMCDRLKKVASGPHPAVVHLFEHHYDPQTDFWYGVADVGCTLEQLTAGRQACGCAGFARLGRMQSPSILARDCLLLGRWGQAKCLRWAETFGPMTEDHLKIAFVCDSPLAPGSFQHRHGQVVIRFCRNGRFIGTVAGTDGPGVRIITKHPIEARPVDDDGI